MQAQAVTNRRLWIPRWWSEVNGVSAPQHMNRRMAIDRTLDLRWT